MTELLDALPADALEFEITDIQAVALYEPRFAASSGRSPPKACGQVPYRRDAAVVGASGDGSRVGNEQPGSVRMAARQLSLAAYLAVGIALALFGCLALF